MKEYLLVSSCLLGKNTKYNGNNNYIKCIEKIKQKYNIIPVCPEVSGGLSIPRPPSEIKDNQVINIEHMDVTRAFLKGANIALFLVKKYHITKALLKDGSPSCGGNKIYDGTFTGTKIGGLGITARLLMENNIAIYTEKEIDKL